MVENGVAFVNPREDSTASLVLVQQLNRMPLGLCVGNRGKLLSLPMNVSSYVL